MLTLIIAAYIFTIALFLSCVAVALTAGQRANRTRIRQANQQLEALSHRLQHLGEVRT